MKPRPRPLFAPGSPLQTLTGARPSPPSLRTGAGGEPEPPPWHAAVPDTQAGVFFEGVPVSTDHSTGNVVPESTSEPEPSREEIFLTRAGSWFAPQVGQYVLDHGRWFPGQPRPAGVRKRPNRRCYRNNLHLMADSADLCYVEGFAVSEGLEIVMPHAWACRRDGHLVDITWRSPETCLYFGVPFDPQTYATTVCATLSESLFYDGKVPADLGAPARLTTPPDWDRLQVLFAVFCLPAVTPDDRAR